MIRKATRVKVPVTVSEVSNTIVVTEVVTEVKKEVGKLSVSFNSEDMNKVVEKINELVDKANDSI